MWRITEGWFTAPKFVSVFSTARWEGRNNVLQCGITGKPYKRTDEAQFLRLMRSGTMSETTVTHQASHLKKRKKGKKEERNRKLFAAITCTETNRWHWCGGWLRIVRSFFPIIGPQPVFGLAYSYCSCERSLRENLRVETSPLIPGADRGLAGSLLWEL